MEEIDEESLEYARQFKKKLRFEPGQIVYLKSDLQFKCPMVIIRFIIHDDWGDYVCQWSTSQRAIETNFFWDKALTYGKIQ